LFQRNFGYYYYGILYFLNMETIIKLGKYYFPSYSGGVISLHHSFAPSLPVRLPYEKARDPRGKI